MDENIEEQMELFCQDGVLLSGAPAAYIGYIGNSGTLSIIELLNSNKTRCIDWKPNDVTIDSDIQDQEWAVVNTVERRTRTLSGNIIPNEANRSKSVKLNFTEIKSFRVQSKSQKLKIYDGTGECLCNFFFQHGNCDAFVSTLKGILRTAPSRRDKHLFTVLDEIPNEESRQLNKSFAELNLFQEQPSDVVWRFVKNFHNRPYETTMEAFSKMTDIVYRGPDCTDEEVHELLNRSLGNTEPDATGHMHEYEVISHVLKLPERKEYPRGRPLSVEQWKALQDHEGRVEDIEAVKLVIFRGGVTSTLRREVWKYLLEYYSWDSTHTQRHQTVKQHSDDYFVMKLQWRSMTKIQEENFSDFRERKNLIEKDVNRTDRTMDYFAGDNNPNLQVLFDILMTYVMYNFDLGYVQGMSDLLSPILHLLDNEVDAFWCFIGFMKKVSSNFDMDQAGMKEQLQHLHTLLAFIEPELVHYLDRHDSGNMFFCFRWLLVWFKRELSEEDVMRLWEVIWTGLPCENFHLLISVAILETEKSILMENNYGFTEILKHINDLSGKIDLPAMISKAEGMYHQIVESDHLTDSVRLILGLPILGNNFDSSKEISPIDSVELNDSNSLDAVTFGQDEVSFERAINVSYL